MHRLNGPRLPWQLKKVSSGCLLLNALLIWRGEPGAVWLKTSICRLSMDERNRKRNALKHILKWGLLK